MNLLEALKSAAGGEALDALSRQLRLSHKQTSRGMYCAASTLAVALVLRMEKGLGMPVVSAPTDGNSSSLWVESLLGAGYPSVLHALAEFAQTTPVQAATLLAFAAETLQSLLGDRIHPGREDAFIRDIYPQKEALMSTLPANVVAALDLTHLQAGLARDFGRGSRIVLRLALLLLAMALLLGLLLC